MESEEASGDLEKQRDVAYCFPQPLGSGQVRPRAGDHLREL